MMSLWLVCEDDGGCDDVDVGGGGDDDDDDDDDVDDDDDDDADDDRVDKWLPIGFQGGLSELIINAKPPCLLIGRPRCSLISHLSAADCLFRVCFVCLNSS